MSIHRLQLRDSIIQHNNLLTQADKDPDTNVKSLTSLNHVLAPTGFH